MDSKTLCNATEHLPVKTCKPLITPPPFFSRAQESRSGQVRRGLVRSARALAAGAFLCLLGVLALPAAARTDGPISVPGQADGVCRPLPSGPPAPTCDGGTEGGVILVGGSAPSEGSVRICHDNEFRSVCDDFFTHRSSGVVCRQLGYPTGIATQRSHFVGDTGAVNYWLDDVDCRGLEANLGDCYHPGWGLHNCGASERVGVICMTRVTGLRPAAGKRQVSLAWDAPRSRYDHGFTGHEYRYKTLSEDGYGPWRAIPDSASRGANVASYTVTGLFEGTWYSFQVRILGGGNASDPGTAGVRTAGEANRLPKFAGPQKRSVAENAAAGAAVGAPVTASDADGETLLYSLEAADDHASFTIKPSSGQIRTTAAHDHEARSRYSVTVKADDGEGGTGTVAVTIEIADVEEQPTDVEIVTGPGSDGVWSAGERVEARVRFAVPVRVVMLAGGRAPELLLAFYGGGGRVTSFGRAAYTGGSGTDTLSFAYTVTQADADAGSVVVPRNALRSGDASIEPATGAPARARAGVSRPSPAAEGGRMAFRVSLARAASYPVRVDYATADGTATAGEDYGAVRDTLTFAPGETEKTVEVPLLADRAAEGDETLTLRLSNARSSSPQELSVDLSPDEAEGTIADGSGAAASAGAVSPLTASFEGMPEAHDGESAFRFRVAFSEPIAISFRSLREDAFEVAGGRVTRGTRVDRRKDLFEITVEPDGAGEVAISLPAGRECQVSGAVCTWGPPRKPLTGTPTATVAGPPAAPLTASFEGVPSEHDGKTAFKLRIAFSETIRMSGRRLRGDVVSVAGGRATKARPVNKRKDRWDLTVKPDSLADVTVTLVAGAACGTPAAVCTKDGRALSNTISATVRGPVAVSVADARAEEGTDETIDFAVTLSRAASGTVAVAYATADGTATAGEDYTARKGQLTFSPGETAKTVSVPVLDDAHDEGTETLTLRLSAATGAVIADGVATGTIENSDPIPQAWLARFGRTVAEQVIEAVRTRLSGPRSTGVRGNFAGHQPAPPQNEQVSPRDDNLAFFEWVSGESDRRPEFRELSGREILRTAAFSATAGENSSGYFSLWGRASLSSFDGRDGETTLDGEVRTFSLGADWSSGPLTAGLSLSRSGGDGGWMFKGAQGEVESSLTGLYPYVGYDLTDRVSLWGVGGYGRGEIELRMPGGNETVRMDTDLSMAAGGVRGDIVSGASGAVSVKADALFARAGSEAARGIAASETDVSRLRLALGGTYRHSLGETLLAPSVELGVRRDGGDAEEGFGVDLGGGVMVSDPRRGLSLELRARGLVAHESEGFEQWGTSVSVLWDRDPSTERGMRLSLGRTLGASSSGGAEALFERNTLEGLGGPGGGGGSFEAEAGYGLAAFGGRGTVVPYVGLGSSGGGWREWRAGGRLRLGPVDGVVAGTLGEGSVRGKEAHVRFSVRVPLGGAGTSRGPSARALVSARDSSGEDGN